MLSKKGRLLLIIYHFSPMIFTFENLVDSLDQIANTASEYCHGIAQWISIGNHMISSAIWNK